MVFDLQARASSGATWKAVRDPKTLSSSEASPPLSFCTEVLTLSLRSEAWTGDDTQTHRLTSRQTARVLKDKLITSILR